MTSLYNITQVTDHAQMLEHWPFILSSLASLNATLKDGDEVTANNFFRCHFDVATGQASGLLLVAKGPNGSYIGFITAIEAFQKYRDGRILAVYAIFAAKNDAMLTKALFAHLENWAKLNGFTEIQAFSGRTSGASIRWCKQKFGLGLSKLMFSKKL